MTSIKIVALSITIFILCTNTFGNDLSSDEILRKVATKYKTMKTYKVEGTTILLEEYDERKGKAEYSFSILLSKPNMYLMTWNQTNLQPGEVFSRTLWSDGLQHYLYNSKINTYYELPSEEIALSKAKINNGPVYVIPQLFLSIFKDYEAPFSWLKDPVIEKIEKLEGEACYVISGTSAISKREAIWVSKKSYLIKKYCHVPDLIKKLHQETGITDEERKFREERLKKTKVTISYTEVYIEISSPKLSKDDFKFTLPEDAIKKNDKNLN